MAQDIHFPREFDDQVLIIAPSFMDLYLPGMNKIKAAYPFPLLK
jgi:hypothetical protein